MVFNTTLSGSQYIPPALPEVVEYNNINTTCGGKMFTQTHLVQLILTIVYSALGLGVFGIGFWIVNKITPFSVRKEIEEDQNTALGIIIGSVIIGLAIIIAAAMT